MANQRSTMAGKGPPLRSTSKSFIAALPRNSGTNRGKSFRTNDGQLVPRGIRGAPDMGPLLPLNMEEHDDGKLHRGYGPDSDE